MPSGGLEIPGLVREALREQLQFDQYGADQSNYVALLALPVETLLPLGEQLLQSEDAAERILGTRLLREMPKPETDQRDLDARIGSQIIALLDHEADTDVVTWAVSALFYVETPGAADTLRKLASHPDPLVRDAVAGAAAAYLTPPPGALDVLTTLARDPNRNVQWSAVYELAAWVEDAPDVRAALQMAALSDDPEIREMGIGGLGRLDGKTPDECPQLANLASHTPDEDAQR